MILNVSLIEARLTLMTGIAADRHDPVRGKRRTDAKATVGPDTSAALRRSGSGPRPKPARPTLIKAAGGIGGGG